MKKAAFIELVSKRIKLIRTEYHYSQDEMSEMLGLSKKTLIQIEKERTLASWSTVVTTCALFNESEVLTHAIGDDPVEFVKLIAQEFAFEPKEKTMGGRVWWTVVEKSPGYTLQQNLISGHYRILDEENVRWYSSFDEADARHVHATLTEKY